MTLDRQFKWIKSQPIADLWGAESQYFRRILQGANSINITMVISETPWESSPWDDWTYKFRAVYIASVCHQVVWINREYTYDHMNATYQRNHDAPVSYLGRHTTEVLTEKAMGFLEDALSGGRPFFLAVSPIAPHSNMNGTYGAGSGPLWMDEPIPEDRHKHLFPEAKVPRMANFNPKEVSYLSPIRGSPRDWLENSLLELVGSMTFHLETKLRSTIMTITIANGSVRYRVWMNSLIVLLLDWSRVTSLTILTLFTPRIMAFILDSIVFPRERHAGSMRTSESHFSCEALGSQREQWKTLSAISTWLRLLWIGWHSPEGWFRWCSYAHSRR